MSQIDDKNNELEGSSTKGMDRREFLKRTAVGVGAVATTMVVGGCGSDNSTSSTPASLVAPVGANSKTDASKKFTFGVMADTQWLAADDGYNPNTSAISIIRTLQNEFINKQVDFVVHVGDMMDATSGSTEGGYGFSTTAIQGEDTRALFVQPLYDAGIGYFPVRGNHDDAGAAEFTTIYPQTGGTATPAGTMNASPAQVYSALANVPAAILKIKTSDIPTKSGSSFTKSKSGVAWGNFQSPNATDLNQSQYTGNLKGLTYTFDYKNARFILIDQFTPADGLLPDGTSLYANKSTVNGIKNADSDGLNNSVYQQLPWIKKVLQKPSGIQHTFVFAHKGLTTQQHQDVLFGKCPADPGSVPAAAVAAGFSPAAGMNDFIRSLYTNGAKMYFCGHDHIHNRSLVWSTDDGAQNSGVNTGAHVTHILCQSNSSKFYTPNEVNASGQSNNPPAYTSNDVFYCGGKRQTQLSQELYTVGYYIVTVDGDNVQADYYSAQVVSSTSGSTENQITISPRLAFTKRETFGYGLNGTENLVNSGESFATKVTFKDGPSGTKAQILAGINGNPIGDYNPITDAVVRQYANAVNTGWVKADGTASDILTLWGMAYLLGSDQTDTYVLQLSYDKSKGAPVLATPSGSGTWSNAVDQNFGGTKKLVQGACPYTASTTSATLDAALGTYGIDATNGVVWAVLNYNSYFAAVTGV